MATSTKNRLNYFNRTPPIAVHAFAIKRRENGEGPLIQRLTVQEIAARSGIKSRTLQRIFYRTDWSGITVDVMCAFCAACGVDILSKRPLARLMKQHGKKKLSFLATRQRKAMDRAILKAKAVVKE